jgi:hypothetical protein
MKIRHSASCSLDEALLNEYRGAVMHPDLHQAVQCELLEMERKGLICRLPATILDFYSTTMQRRIESLTERCQTKIAMLTS